MEMQKQYEPSAVEGRVYEQWLTAGAFVAAPDDRDGRYVVMMPLPNVTGALHMGHAMDNVMQDLLVRWHRMRGENTLWMPGTDHAGIATQAIVEKFLFEAEGKTRNDVGRDELMRRIWVWKGEQERQIIRQQQRMGCSCDWARHRFTLDPVCAAAVREWFFRLFRDGLVYRGDRLVNWDCHLQTAVSDDEVFYKTVPGALWYLRYPVIAPRPGQPEFVRVATTRPETLLGDTAVACHPDPAGALAARIADLEAKVGAASNKERPELAAALESVRRRIEEQLPELERVAALAAAGGRLRLPLLEREIPLIRDEWAKPDVGTGCVKITPGHDPNDYLVWQRHRNAVGILNILQPNGTLNAAAGMYEGLDIPTARKRVVADLEARGLVELVEARAIDLGHSDRSKTPIEPYLSRQWFVRMGDVAGGVELGRGTPNAFRAAGLAQAALDAARPSSPTPSGRTLRFHPDAASYGSIYANWLAEKRDWCVSRQLWWGHQIPIWHGRIAWDRLGDLRDALAAEPAESLWVWVASPDGQQLPLARAIELAEPLPDFEVQVCIRREPGESRAASILAAFGLARDPDVLDTWFSSALWPHSTLGWPDPAILGDAQRGPTQADVLTYYYPGSCLVTGRDIITLWVARMMIAGLYNLGDVPFTDCFVHATILDGNGETMSKSKGNGVDPAAIIDRYGADAMRYLICHMQTGAHYARLPVHAVCPRYDRRTHPTETIDLAHARHGKTRQGEDNPFTYICPACQEEFDVSGTIQTLRKAAVVSDRFEMGRNFCTKLWSAVRFTLLQQGRAPFQSLTPGVLPVEDRWILSRLTAVIAEISDALEAYNPSAALAAARRFFWDELCDWYLELLKARLRTATLAAEGIQVLTTALDHVLRLLHPFVPFITEELWERLREHAPIRGIETPLPTGTLLVRARWPQPVPAWHDADAEADVELLQRLVRSIRDARATHGLGDRSPLEASIKAPAETRERLGRLERHVLHLGALARLDVVADGGARPRAIAVVVGDVELYLSTTGDERAAVLRLEKQREIIERRIQEAAARLGNPAFLERAPASVVEGERARRSALDEELALVVARLRDLSLGGSDDTSGGTEAV